MSSKGPEMLCVALGEDVAEDVVEAELERPADIEARLSAVEKQMLHITNAHDSLFSMVKHINDNIDRESHKQIEAIVEKKKSDMVIPEGTVLTGKTKAGGSRDLSYFMQVKNGAFYVGITRYESVSAAAEGVSGVRRSGWAFWKFPDGKSIKEAFRN